MILEKKIHNLPYNLEPKLYLKISWDNEKMPNLPNGPLEDTQLTERFWGAAEPPDFVVAGAAYDFGEDDLGEW